MSKSKQAGVNGKDGTALWLTDNLGNYYCSHIYNRTPQQLMAECLTTVKDLLRNHPDLAKLVAKYNKEIK